MPELGDGWIEVDNNPLENAIRSTAIGKKNWLFMGSADAGETGAILFTLVECCRRRGIDAFEHLRDVLERIPSMSNHQVGELVPEVWAGKRRPALPRAA
jgi:transposase